MSFPSTVIGPEEIARWIAVEDSLHGHPKYKATLSAYRTAIVQAYPEVHDYAEFVTRVLERMEKLGIAVDSPRPPAVDAFMTEFRRGVDSLRADALETSR